VSGGQQRGGGHVHAVHDLHASSVASDLPVLTAHA